MSTAVPKSPKPPKAPKSDKILNWIERVGNKLPEPFMLFLILFAVTALVTTFMAMGNVEVTVPGTDKPTVIKGLLTGEGLSWLTQNIGENYVGFPPLKTVLPILLAIGIALHSGMLAALMRSMFGAAPRWLLPYVVGIVGVFSSIMADTSNIVIPPLAALVFKAAGRHPVAGLLGGFAAAGAGYSTNFVPTSLDALFAGITTSVMGTLPGTDFAPVNPVSNWFFNIVASIILGLLAGLLIDKIIEPRIVRLGVSRDEMDPDGNVSTEDDAETMNAKLEPKEKKGLFYAGLVTVVVAAVVLWAVLIPNSPWRNEGGGFLPKSPLLDSIVFLVFLFFIVPGLVYGWTVGKIRNINDATKMMGESIKEMLGFLILAFILGQFIALFNWSGIGAWIAVTGANFLESIHLTGFAAIVGFILLASVLNLFITSGSSMWSIMAAVFVPLFALIGYEPAFTQAAFRVGDSATQVMTPMNPYMVVLLGMLRRYEPSAGLGTLMARMLPFTIVFWIVWLILLAIWFFADLPLGPGNGIFLP
ncbi:AbgT family transporter [Brevibacterium sp. 50QC2O2]|uniref:AbgT family transporter n=1 Tax=unclassified Brevibacterium TaxID=2614124 RepID=UPI00211BE71A|nr:MULTISPECIES: AbgT family transporter [unclassified Brevibacterium]MCQ9367182.1 AbgT family transporter [Brevibacterium sp. 91QC2O2]MCQ9388112.1 AbgT family transporter [Brevibacterium sp. 50QC2O2]